MFLVRLGQRARRSIHLLALDNIRSLQIRTATLLLKHKVHMPYQVSPAWTDSVHHTQTCVRSVSYAQQTYSSIRAILQYNQQHHHHHHHYHYYYYYCYHRYHHWQQRFATFLQATIHTAVVAAVVSAAWITEVSLNPSTVHLDASSAPQQHETVLREQGYAHFRSLKPEFTEGRELGRGAFAVTFAVTLNNNQSSGTSKMSVADDKSTRVFACKRIPKDRLQTQDDEETIRTELKLLRKVQKHDNIVQVFDAFESDSDIYIILELCSGGELFDRIISKGAYREKDAAKIIRDLLLIAKHCHDRGVVHRDIKPENILFDRPGDNGAVLKLIDFGLSTEWKLGQILDEPVGTPYYVAPEVILGHYDNKSDIFSIGCILYILLCGSPPFDGETDEDILRCKLDREFSMKDYPWDTISSDAKEVVTLMLQKDPDKRPSVDKLLKHPWINQSSPNSMRKLDADVQDRLKQFHQINRMKRHALMIMAQFVEERDLTQVKNLFHEIDKDKSNTIDREELKLCFQRLKKNYSDEEIDLIMKAFDLSGNGVLSFHEFVAITLSYSKLCTEETLQKTFKKFDISGSGFVTVSELTEVMKEYGISKEIAKALMQEYDLDNSGTIDFDEFKQMMRISTARDSARRLHNPLSRINLTALLNDESPDKKKEK